MSLQFAVSNGFELKTGPKQCGYLQFADGSYDKTVGQVETFWTFTSWEMIPVIFEILEYCCSEVVIGADMLIEQLVFQKYADSLSSIIALDDNCAGLPPFDYVRPWQERCKKLFKKLALTEARGELTKPRLSQKF